MRIIASKQRLSIYPVALACVAALLLLGNGITIAGDADDKATASVKTVKPHQYVYIVYLNPVGRECVPTYEERLDRVMTEVQAWYRAEMERNGFGPLTFPLERDENGKLVIHVVQGTRAYAEEEPVTSNEMRDQVKGPLLEEGIDVEQEHIIIFANTKWVTRKDGDIIVRSWSHYVGGGNHKSGTAWVTDCEILDPLNLPKKTPKVLDGGTRPYTIGKYNVTYIGGVAHEFGHSLGLPHNFQTDAQREKFGWTLMGSGNYHFLAKRAGDDEGDFLSLAHATILSSHPLFTRNAEGVDVEPKIKWNDIRFSSGEGEYIITGRVKSTPAAYAVVAYHDRMQKRADYDATSWVGTVGPDGRFEVRVGDLTPGMYETRLRCFFVNGAYRQLTHRFKLDESLKVPGDALVRQTLYELCIRPALEKRDPEAMVAGIEQLKAVDDAYYRRAKAYHRLMTQKEPDKQVALAEIGEDVREVPLGSVKWASAKVGGGLPRCNNIDGDTPLESANGLHATGLNAYANSRYVYDLDGKWKTLTGSCGLQIYTSDSVYFIIKGDGKELYHSELVRGWEERPFEVDLAGVDRLELIVDGDGFTWGDYAVWFSPMLKR